jgi:carbamoyl-phosphate synthase large subunit
VKEAVFPFARFPGVDTVLGPEMRSTGEVMGLDMDFGRAFAKSQLGAGSKVPVEGVVFVSVKDQDKQAMIKPMKRLAELGFKVVATGGTSEFLRKHGVEAQRVNKVLEGRPHIVDLMKDGKVQLVFNTVDGASALTDSFTLRRTALMHKIAYYTTVAGCKGLGRGYCGTEGRGSRRGAPAILLQDDLLDPPPDNLQNATRLGLRSALTPYD